MLFDKISIKYGDKIRWISFVYFVYYEELIYNPRNSLLLEAYIYPSTGIEGCEGKEHVVRHGVVVPDWEIRQKNCVRRFLSRGIFHQEGCVDVEETAEMYVMWLEGQLLLTMHATG